jgi:hypothetical protein
MLGNGMPVAATEPVADCSWNDPSDARVHYGRSSYPSTVFFSSPLQRFVQVLRHSLPSATVDDKVIRIDVVWHKHQHSRVTTRTTSSDSKTPTRSSTLVHQYDFVELSRPARYRYRHGLLVVDLEGGVLAVCLLGVAGCAALSGRLAGSRGLVFSSARAAWVEDLVSDNGLVAFQKRCMQSLHSAVSVVFSSICIITSWATSA